MKKTRSKEMSRKLNVAIEILCLSRVFLPATNCYLIVTFNSTPLFCTFTLLHLFSFLFFFFFLIYGNKLQDFCSIKYIFREIFLSFQHPAVRDFKFPRHFNPRIFVKFNSCDLPLKVAKTFSLHSRHFL